MKFASLAGIVIVVGCVAAVSHAGDWPQFRGPQRDGRVSDFAAPEKWPEKLTEKWKVSVGDGVASPVLVDGKLFVFTRQEGEEVVRCLQADTGEEIWREGFASRGVGGAAGGFPGPRSTPAVADGKVVTLGVEGVLICRDAATGKELWRKSDYKDEIPRFATSSSPILVDGLCIAQLGDDRSGVIAAYDLTTGEEKWKLSGTEPSYGSPNLVKIGDVKAIVAPAEGKMVAVNAADGKLLWDIRYVQGRYNAATPMVDGEKLVFAGPTRGLTAVKLEQKEGKLEAADAWRNEESSVQYNTPVVREKLLFGLSNLNSLFCVNAETGTTAWTAPIGGGAAAVAPREGDRREEGRREEGPRGERPRDGGRFGGGRFGGGRRGFGGGGSGGYGTVVDAGSAIFALPVSGQLIVFEPTAEAFKQLATYKVAEGSTYGYPIITGNRIYVKDRDALTLWTIE